MCKKFIFLIRLLVLSLAITFAVPSIVLAIGDNKETAYDIQIFKDDQKFNLPKNTSSYWFNLPKGFNITDNSYVEIHFTFSNTLINNRSNITVLINDYPIDTRWIYDIQNTTSGLWNIKLPVSKLRIDGLNEIKFQSNQRSIEGDCADIDNPSNWVILHKDSKLHVTVDKYPNASMSNFYPIYCDNFLKDDTLSTDFIVPKNTDNNSILSLFKISSSIGKMYISKNNIDYNVLMGSDEEINRNKVFIGPYSSFTNGNNLLNIGSNKLSKDEGYLSISQGNGLGYNTVVTGEDGVGLNKAVDFISDNNLLKQITANSIRINSNLPKNNNGKDISANGVYKFSDFGYSDINLKGAFHQKVDLSFVQPKGIQNLKGSYIELKFKHSKVLDSDRSVITAYINGMPENSAKLTVANAEDGTLKVNIPESALKLPEIKVSIECYNYLGKVDCSKDYYDSAWTVINSYSKVCLVSGEESIQPSMKIFPYFYTKFGNDIQKVLVGLPNYSDPVNLKTVSMMSTRIGQNTGEVFDWDAIGNNNEPTDKQKKMNMIFLGTYSNAKIPESIKKQLYVVPSQNGKLDIKKDIDLIPETLKDKVVFQVIRSPWDTSKRIYVILYDNSTSLQLLNTALSDRNILTKLDGQISVLDNNKKLHNINVQETKTVKVTRTIWEKAKYIEFKTKLPLWALLTISGAVIAGIVTIIYLRRDKNHFEKVGKKMKGDSGFLDEDNKEIKSKEEDKE